MEAAKIPPMRIDNADNQCKLKVKSRIIQPTIGG